MAIVGSAANGKRMHRFAVGVCDEGFPPARDLGVIFPRKELGICVVVLLLAVQGILS